MGAVIQSFYSVYLCWHHYTLGSSWTIKVALSNVRYFELYSILSFFFRARCYLDVLLQASDTICR
jgi:hypothetical protein